MKPLRILFVLGILGVSAGWFFTRPQPLPETALAGLVPDPVNGAVVFAAAGCGTCHAGTGLPDDLLTGGRRFETEFGVFVAPNISSDPDHGVGAWRDIELASAIMRGVGREGGHIYPVLPYSTYNKASLQDVADLIAYMRTLPASDQTNADNELSFPFNQRIGLGVWKAVSVTDEWTLTEAATPEVERGRYLVEALGHCAECHTPRGVMGGLDRNQWMAGAPAASGEGRVPNITDGALRWSQADIAEYLKSGFTPDFDVVGGSMASVVRNTAKLSDEDRSAIAAYLKTIPAVAPE